MSNERNPDIAGVTKRWSFRQGLTRRRVLGAGVAVVMLAALAPIAMAARPLTPDFAFVHISDIHTSPLTQGQVNDRTLANARGADTIKWVCEQARGPQRLAPQGITTPPTAFVIATGDVTEFGVIGKTWNVFEQLFKPLEMPIYITAGNHDNTWTSIVSVMRAQYGGDHYSFEQFGCHFACIDSAGIQEPLPCLEARTLAWLREDLKQVPPDRPVLLFAHHPLSSTEFAKPFEQLRLLDAIRDHNVVLMMMGHGHSVRAEKWNGLDSVMGGSTFGPNSGYSIISVIDGVLRVVYRYKDDAKPMKTLLEKPIARPELPEVEIALPRGDAVVTGGAVDVAVRTRGAAVKQVTAGIDGRKSNQSKLNALSGGYAGKVSTRHLTPGRHYLRVQAETAAGPFDRAVEFLYAPANAPLRESRVDLAAGMKARPALVNGECVVATTSGQVAKIKFPARGPATGAPEVLFDTNVEVIHAPAVADGTLYFSSAELGVFSVGLDGKLNWKRPVGAVVYGTPAVMGDAVYVGDLEGFVHAIDRKTGKLRWSKKHAEYSIEMPLLAHDGTLYFGAWDGYVYAVSAVDGSLVWKQRGPAGQTGDRALGSRYYAPADCTPVLAGGRLFVTDRSYRLGSYDLDGKYLGQISENVAAIGPTEDGSGFYARGLSKGLTRYDAEGKTVWTRPVEMGRFPCPPTAVGGRVYACSNQGLLVALSATDGQMLWEYQAAPQLHVMAPVAADAEGNVYVAGMDGSVIQVRSEK